MAEIYGKNNLTALNVSLAELYVLRRSQSNTLPLYELDRHMLDRPDWVVYRLIRERQPQSILDLPTGCNGGVELLLSTLQKAANSSDPLIKWAVYGLIAFWMLRVTQVEEQLWYIRMPQKVSGIEIADGDRIRKEDLEKILKWMESRQKKFEASTPTSTDASFRATHNSKPSHGQLSYAEQLLLLALGKISIFLVLQKLKRERSEQAHETYTCVLDCLRAANGGWQPGKAIFLNGLQHYRQGFQKNVFSSCFLPFTTLDYCDWLAAATGVFAKKTKGYLDNHLRMLIGITSVQQREWLFLKANNAKYSTQAADALMISIDRTFGMAIESRRIVLAGGLAARFLSIGNIRGWDNVHKMRLESARLMKAAAKISGCLVQGEAVKRDFSSEHKNFDPHSRGFIDQSEEYVSLLRAPSNLTHNAESSIASDSFNVGHENSISDLACVSGDKIVPDSLSVSQEDQDLIPVAKALRFPFHHPSTANGRFDVLKIAVICLTPEKGIPDNLNKLLDINHHVFNVFVDALLVSGIAMLSEQLFARDKFQGSALSDAQNVIKFAELLLYWLERPYMADISDRARWQRQLWRVYLALDEQKRSLLPLGDKLLVYAAISNVTAASIKGLRESHADQLEKTIYEEGDSANLPIHNAGARTNLRVSADDLWNILNRYEERGLIETAFVQIILTPGGNDLMLLVARKYGTTIMAREALIKFIPICHQDIKYDSWDDLSNEVGQHPPYFKNDETGDLHELDASPLGQPSIRFLWQRIEELIFDVGFKKIPGHLCISPDPILANIPWQLIAMKISPPIDYPLITLVHGLRWIYMSAHDSEDMVHKTTTFRRFHNRGIHAWIAPNPTPRIDLDLRTEVRKSFFGADNNHPALVDQPGVSLSVVFGHGTLNDSESLATVEAIEHLQEWDYVRESRICVLLSCETGGGVPGALGDYLSISHKLCRNSKALILAPVKVSHKATQALCAVFHEAIHESLAGRNTWRVQEVYKEAIRRHPGVALFSLWGLGYEPLVWKPQTKPVIK